MSSSRLAIAFACFGHVFMHLLVSLFVTIVLALERDWQLSYDDLIGLWTLGAFMLGAAAPLAGWLSDRYGEVRLMVVFFLGSGLSTVYAGFADSPGELLIALSLLGVFAAVYHPVGMAWVVKNAVGRGRTLAFVGIMGSLGLAGASAVAGGLTDAFGWRSAFIVPGGAAILAGLVLAGLRSSGHVIDRESDLAPVPEESRENLIRAFIVLLGTMVLGSLFYTAFATVLPKWIDDGLSPVLEMTTATVGGLVTMIYLFGATGQLLGGWLADRYSLKLVYAASFAAKIPITLVAAEIGGWPLVMVAVAIGFTLDLSGPVENILLAKYSPRRRRGLIYGLKYVASFAAAPLGVQLVAWSYGWSGDAKALYLCLALIAALMLLGALFLPAAPGQRTEPSGARRSMGPPSGSDRARRPPSRG